MTDTTPTDNPLATAAQASLANWSQGPMSPALAIMLDPVMFERAKQIATYMSRAEGFTPQHLLGKTEACFAVVTRALTWRLDPFGVAMATYQTPGGKIGFEGSLCQAILENSGHLEGPVRFRHYGDWSRVTGKFRFGKSDKGKEYAQIAWTREDAKGCGVVVSAKVKGEPEPREWPLDLEQCFPLNSTLWATDPKTQICYTAVRRFGKVAAPGLMMGVPFDREDWQDDGNPSRAKDVTPATPIPTGKPKLEQWVESRRAATAEANGDAGHDPETGEVAVAAVSEHQAELDAAADAAYRGPDEDQPELLADLPTQTDPDPLKVGKLSAKDAVSVIELGIRDADAAEADRLLAAYRTKLERVAPKAYQALTELVTAKIEGKAGG